METIVMLSVIGGLALLIGIAVLRGTMRRRAACRALAAEMSLEYRASVPEIVAELGDARLLHGSAHRSANVLSDTRRGQRVVLLDLSYTTGSGRRMQAHVESMCVVRGSRLRLPRFLAQGHALWLDGVFSATGVADINFDEDAAFSRSFVLKGDDEAATRAVFGPVLRAHLMTLPDRLVRIEGAGDTFLLAHSPPLPVSELPALLEQTLALVDILTAARRPERR